MKSLILTTFLTLNLLVLWTGGPVAAQSLETELNTLNFEKMDQLPASSSRERLYSIQDRMMMLKNRFEFIFGGGHNFSGNSFLVSRQLSLEGQFHFNNAWSIALATSQAQNSWSSSAQQFIDQQSLVPDVDYLESRSEARVQYNLFYGKMRWLRNSVSYYDLFVSAGYAVNQLSSGASGGPVADIGVAHWIGNWGSVRWGFKDYYYEEKGRITSGTSHNVFGYVGMGYVFR